MSTENIYTFQEASNQISVAATNSKIQDHAGHDPTMLITSINLALKTTEHAIIAWTEIHNALGEKLSETYLEGIRRVHSIQHY